MSGLLQIVVNDFNYSKNISNRRQKERAMSYDTLLPK